MRAAASPFRRATAASRTWPTSGGEQGALTCGRSQADGLGGRVLALDDDRPFGRVFECAPVEVIELFRGRANVTCGGIFRRLPTITNYIGPARLSVDAHAHTD